MAERMQFIDKRTGEALVIGLSLLMNQRPEGRPQQVDIDAQIRANSSDVLPRLLVLASSSQVRAAALLATVGASLVALDAATAHAATPNCDFEVRFNNPQVADTVQIRNADDPSQVLASARIEPGRQVLPVKGGPSNATVTDPSGRVHDGKKIVQTSNLRPNHGPEAVVACGNWIQGMGPLPGRPEPSATSAPVIVTRTESTPTPAIIVVTATAPTATSAPPPPPAVALQPCPDARELGRFQDSITRLNQEISAKDQEISSLKTQIALTSPTIWRDIVFGAGGLAIGLVLGMLGREGAIRSRTGYLRRDRDDARRERADAQRDLQRTERQRDALQAQLDTANENLDPAHVGGTVQTLIGERTQARNDLATATTNLTARTGELTTRTAERDNARRAAYDVLEVARIQAPAALTAANIGTLPSARAAVRAAIVTIRATLPWPRP